MRLEFTEESCVMTMKNHAKFGEELTCHFKIDMRNLTNFDPSTHFNGIFLTKVYNVWAKKSTEELYLIGLKIDTMFEGKLFCAFQNDMSNLPNFYRLKKSDFILERKMAKLNQNQNSKQAD